MIDHIYLFATTICLHRLKDSTIEVDRLPGVSFHNNKQILEIHNFSSRYTGVYKCNVKVGDRNGEIDRIFDVPPMQRKDLLNVGIAQICVKNNFKYEISSESFAVI